MNGQITSMQFTGKQLKALLTGTSICTICKDAGYLWDQSYGYAEMPDGWVPVQSCDGPAHRPMMSDEDAARAAATSLGGTSVAVYREPKCDGGCDLRPGRGGHDEHCPVVNDDPGDWFVWQHFNSAPVYPEDMMLPAPTDHPRVIMDPGYQGWLYDSNGRPPSGDYHWTAHLTNALHDAGWQVMRERHGAGWASRAVPR